MQKMKREKSKVKTREINNYINSLKKELCNVTFSLIKDSWSEILNKLKKDSLYGFVSLSEGFPSSINEKGNLVISFHKENSFHKKRLEEARNKKAVEAVISEVLGQNIEIECAIDNIVMIPNIYFQLAKKALIWILEKEINKLKELLLKENDSKRSQHD